MTWLIDSGKAAECITTNCVQYPPYVIENIEFSTDTTNGVFNMTINPVTFKADGRVIKCEDGSDTVHVILAVKVFPKQITTTISESKIDSHDMINITAMSGCVFPSSAISLQWYYYEAGEAPKLYKMSLPTVSVLPVCKSGTCGGDGVVQMSSTLSILEVQTGREYYFQIAINHEDADSKDIVLVNSTRSYKIKQIPSKIAQATELPVTGIVVGALAAFLVMVSVIIVVVFTVRRSLPTLRRNLLSADSTTNCMEPAIDNVERKEEGSAKPALKYDRQASDWLNKSYTALKVMERTEDMEIRIEQLEEAKLIYKMTEGGRKMCLIIANSKFSRQARLEACKLDCRYLTALFTGLNFDVEGKENLTAEGIKAFLEDKKRHLDVDLECFACVITSHGDPRGILGIDDAVIEFQNILDMFDRDHCPELANKPKLFLFDVCRRSGVDLVQLKAKKIVNYTMIPPTKSDILVAHATTNDYVSFCDRNYGSRFCRSFVKVVSENACRYSILDMLLMVNEMVGEFTSGGVLQSVQFDCSMRKQFFFPLPVIRQAKAIAAHETKTSLEEDRDVKQTGL